MAFRQSKRVKEAKQIKLYKNFTLWDFVYIFVGMLFAAIIAAIPLYGYGNLIVGGSLFAGLFLVSLLGLIKLKSHGVRIYGLFVRILKYVKDKKQYTGVEINKLFYYQDDGNKNINSRPIKIVVGKLKRSKYIKILRVYGHDISNETIDMQEMYLQNLTNALNQISSEVAIIKIPTLVDINDNKKDLDVYNEVIKDKNAEKYEDNYSKLYDSYKEDINNGLSRYIDAYYIASIGIDELTCDTQAKNLVNELSRSGLKSKILNFNEGVKVLRKIFWNQNIEYESGDPIYDIDEIIFEKDHFIMDGNYYKVQGIMTLPSRLDNNYVARMFDSPSIVVWNLAKMDLTRLMNDLSKGEVRSEINGGDEKNRVLMRRNQIALNDLGILIDKVASGDDVVFRSDVKFITQGGRRLSQLKLNSKYNEDNFKKWSATIDNYKYRQREALTGAIVGNNADNTNDSYEVISSNIGYAWPFVNDYFNDGVFNLVGHENISGATGGELGDQIYFDMRDITREGRINRNMFVVGGSGSGKTTFSKKILLQMVAKGDKVIIIDPQSEWESFAKKVGGQVINYGGAGMVVINPLQLRKLWDPQDPNAREVIIDNDVIFTQNNSFFLNWISILYPSIKKEKLEVHIKEGLQYAYYKHKFINKEGDVLIKGDITKLDDKKYPIMSDFIDGLKKVVEKLKTEDDPDYHLLRKLHKEIELDFTKGMHKKRYNNHSTLKIDNDLLVFNVSALSGEGSTPESRAAGFYLIVAYLQGLITEQYAKKAKERKVIDDITIKEQIWIMMDEVHKFMDPRNLIVLDFILLTVKEGRKFDAGTILSTQSPVDFAKTKEIKEYGETILASMQYAALFKLDGKQIDLVNKLYEAGESVGLSNNERQWILNATKGQCLLMVDNKKHIPIQVHYNPIEQDLCFTK